MYINLNEKNISKHIRMYVLNCINYIFILQNQKFYYLRIITYKIIHTNLNI